MGEFLQALRKAALFLLTAQVLQHLGPGRKYEKYVKMMISLAILAQLVSPILSWINDDGMEGFRESVERYERDNEEFTGRLQLLTKPGEGLELEGVVRSVEQLLVEPAAQAGVRIDRVMVSEGKLVIEVGALDMAGRTRKGSDMETLPAGSGKAPALGSARACWRRQDLAEDFAQRLGIKADNVEVVEFG